MAKTGKTTGMSLRPTKFCSKQAEQNGDMSVTISPGIGWLKADAFWGTVIFEGTATTLTSDMADSALDRIDVVCARLDKNTNAASLLIKKGSYDPQPAVMPDTNCRLT